MLSDQFVATPAGASHPDVEQEITMGNFHRLAVTHSSHNRRAHFPQPSGAYRRRSHSNRAHRV